MKDKIHPKYVVTKVTCGCGNTFVTRGAQAELKIKNSVTFATLSIRAS